MKKLFKLSWVFLITILIGVCFFESNFYKYLLIICIVTNILLIVEFKNVQPALLMLIFFASYPIYLIPYYFYDYIITANTKYFNVELYNKAVLIHTIFITCFYAFLSTKLNKAKLLLRDLVPKRNNFLIFYFLLLLMFFLILTIKGSSVASDFGDSYALYVENLNNQGGSLEYFYILYICAFFFTNKKSGKKLLVVLALFYCYSCIIRGFRVQMLQMIFLVYILYFDGKFKNYQLLILSVLGFALSEITSVLKLYGTITIENVSKIFELSSQSKIIINNQTDVFYSSVVYLGLLRDGIIDDFTRLLSTLGFMMNWIIPSSFVLKEARLPEFGHLYTDFGGGGIISVFFYVWFGYLGVIILGFSLAHVFNNLFTYERNNYKIIGIIILSVFPRWFAYDPGNFLMRFSVYTIVLFFILIIIDQKMKTISKKVQ